MRIDRVKIYPNLNSINPEILLEIDTIISRGYEIPIELSGIITTEDRKKISDIYKVSFFSTRDITLFAYNGFNNEEQPLRVNAKASLNDKILNYIDSVRNVNTRGDVILNLEMKFQLAISKVRANHFRKVSSRDLSIQLPNHLESIDLKAVLFEYQRNFQRGQDALWILSTDDLGLVEMKTEEFNIDHQISSSDWIQDYCPVFELGRYFVFEYLLPDFEDGSGSIEERLNAAINAVKEMKEYLISCEWNGLIEKSRSVMELIRNQEEIIQLLKDDGYTEQAASDLNNAIKNLFDFTSKFIHSVDRAGNELNPDIQASKEDAYFVYTLCVTLVNLISKKRNRLLNN